MEKYGGKLTPDFMDYAKNLEDKIKESAATQAQYKSKLKELQSQAQSNTAVFSQHVNEMKELREKLDAVSKENERLKKAKSDLESTSAKRQRGNDGDLL